MTRSLTWAPRIFFILSLPVKLGRENMKEWKKFVSYQMPDLLQAMHVLCMQKGMTSWQALRIIGHDNEEVAAYLANKASISKEEKIREIWFQEEEPQQIRDPIKVSKGFRPFTVPEFEAMVRYLESEKRLEKIGPCLALVSSVKEVQLWRFDAGELTWYTGGYTNARILAIKTLNLVAL